MKMPDHNPDPYQSDDESGYPWDCDWSYEDLGNYGDEGEDD